MLFGQPLWIGNRVQAAAVKRVAFYKSSQRKITPSKNTVSIYSLFCIGGTGWIKPTILAKQWAERKAVQLNKA